MALRAIRCRENGLNGRIYTCRDDSPSLLRDVLIGQRNGARTVPGSPLQLPNGGARLSRRGEASVPDVVHMELRQSNTSCCQPPRTLGLGTDIAKLLGAPSLMVYAAWGRLIAKKPYITDPAARHPLLAEIASAQWMRRGELTGGKHPPHPLNVTHAEPLVPFDVTSYAQNLSAALKNARSTSRSGISGLRLRGVSP